MTVSNEEAIRDHDTRRGFLRIAGGATVVAGGLSLLAACKEDGIVTSDDIARETPTATPTLGAVPPTYTATDNDRLNFALQIHYLLAAYLQRGIAGSTIAASLTTGGGTAGAVTGGQQVSITDPVVLTSLREARDSVLGRIAMLRQTLGSAVLAQPAINISGGANSPFQTISVTPLAAGSTEAPIIFNPYASQDDFLLGAVALFSVAVSATSYQAWQVAATLRGTSSRLAAGTAADGMAVRNTLYYRARQQARDLPVTQILFERSWRMAERRNFLDGPIDFEAGIGWFAGGSDFGSRLQLRDGNWNVAPRTAEQALALLYGTRDSVSSGAFFPSGVNGTIRFSGNNNFV